VSQSIELGIERLNHGHWLKVMIPYDTELSMTAKLLNSNGELLRSIKLATGNNLIDLEAISDHTLHVRIDTPFEIISRNIKLE